MIYLFSRTQILKKRFSTIVPTDCFACAAQEIQHLKNAVLVTLKNKIK